ncbi:hypothetical protein BC628DRAFT_1409719 [Trametes gibbosa]|nr:hypothetical protein BC628DRAFT_1409719 [Trametes gibbosa]
MRCFAILALAATLSAASAAQISRRQTPTYPDCSLPCLASADFGSCDPQDNNCLCHSQDFINSTTACISKACTGDDLKNAEAAAQSACAAVVRRSSICPPRAHGVTLTSAAAPTSTAPAPLSDSASVSVTTTPTPSTSAAPNSAASRGANALAALAVVGAAAFVL